MSVANKIAFALKYKTWKRVAPCKSSDSEIAVYHKGREIKLKRLCPHQGLPLDKGYFKGDFFVCPWHGCHFPLSEKGGAIRPFMPAFSQRPQP